MQNLHWIWRLGKFSLTQYPSPVHLYHARGWRTCAPVALDFEPNHLRLGNGANAYAFAISLVLQRVKLAPIASNGGRAGAIHLANGAPCSLAKTLITRLLRCKMRLITLATTSSVRHIICIFCRHTDGSFPVPARWNKQSRSSLERLNLVVSHPMSRPPKWVHLRPPGWLQVKTITPIKRIQINPCLQPVVWFN